MYSGQPGTFRSRRLGAPPGRGDVSFPDAAQMAKNNAEANRLMAIQASEGIEAARAAAAASQVQADADRTAAARAALQRQEDAAAQNRAAADAELQRQQAMAKAAQASRDAMDAAAQAAARSAAQVTAVQVSRDAAAAAAATARAVLTAIPAGGTVVPPAVPVTRETLLAKANGDAARRQIVSVDAFIKAGRPISDAERFRIQNLAHLREVAVNAPSVSLAVVGTQTPDGRLVAIPLVETSPPVVNAVAQAANSANRDAMSRAPVVVQAALTPSNADAVAAQATGTDVPSPGVLARADVGGATAPTMGRGLLIVGLVLAGLWAANRKGRR